jgi:hypothetical protein
MDTLINTLKIFPIFQQIRTEHEYFEHLDISSVFVPSVSIVFITAPFIPMIWSATQIQTQVSCFDLIKL